MKLRMLNPFPWGVSIALSWTWGLGLFFSVQIAIQFGLGGLLAFAIPNALGLIAFGLFTSHIARKAESSRDFERHFLQTVGSLRWMFLLYQIVAIALTFFAMLKYIFLPLGFPLLMVALLVLGASLLLGEQFGIAQIKWTHLGMGTVILLSILLIGWGGGSYFQAEGRIPRPAPGQESVWSLPFLGYFVPIVVGFLLGPWLDIQQWQRAIQIRREKTSISTSYLLGAVLFFGILLFHGTLALAIWGEGSQVLAGGTAALTQPAGDGLLHFKDSIVRFLFLSEVATPLLFRVMYPVFLCLCVIATLDSGYVALKWFQADAVKKSESVLLSLIPKSFLNSPLPPFALATIVALVTVYLDFELEYFMSFYASFSVGYSMVFLFRTTYAPRFTSFTQTTLVSLAAFSLGIFGIGYFQKLPFLMVIGCLIPLSHAIVCIVTRRAVEEIRKSGVIDRIAERDFKGVVSKFRPGEGHEDQPVTADTSDLPVPVESSADLSPQVSATSGLGSSWFEGKWFVHRFITTYQDTNSTGNVYFAQYAMWVGKARELFFSHALPNFDIRTTNWFILTRKFEHSFARETREFEEVEVKLRISDFNRKFVTMEHRIYDSAKTLLGKGRQVLLFVSSSDYNIIDIPAECQTAFLPYV